MKLLKCSFPPEMPTDIEYWHPLVIELHLEFFFPSSPSPTVIELGTSSQEAFPNLTGNLGSALALWSTSITCAKLAIASSTAGGWRLTHLSVCSWFVISWLSSAQGAPALSNLAAEENRIKQNFYHRSKVLNSCISS